MGFGSTSIFLFAVGAVLRFAVSATSKGFNLHTLGLILLIVGVIGLVISALWMTVWAKQRLGAATVATGQVPAPEVPVRDTEIY